MSDFIVTPKRVYSRAAIACAEQTGDGRIALTLVTGYKITTPDPDGSLWEQLTSPPIVTIPTLTPAIVCKEKLSTPRSSPKATSPTKS
jgi:hypothetical protein